MTGDTEGLGGHSEDAVVQADDGDLVEHEHNFIHDCRIDMISIVSKNITSFSDRAGRCTYYLHRRTISELPCEFHGEVWPNVYRIHIRQLLLGQ